MKNRLIALVVAYIIASCGPSSPDNSSTPYRWECGPKSNCEVNNDQKNPPKNDDEQGKQPQNNSKIPPNKIDPIADEASGQIKIDLTAINLKDAAESLRASIAAGNYDGLGYSTRMTASALYGSSGVNYTVEPLAIDSKTFNSLPADQQDQIIAEFLKAYELLGFKVYRAAVDLEKNKFGTGSLPEQLGIDLDQLKKSGSKVDGSQLLSEFAQNWSYKASLGDGPNCWQTSIASIAKGWKKARYMGPKEFSCHVEKAFAKLSKPEKWGDLIRLIDRNTGEEVHGFVYLGVDRETESKKIVFTKNGFRQGLYTFMDFDTVVSKVYPNTVATYHRAKSSSIPDPAIDSGSPCAREYQEEKP